MAFPMTRSTVRRSGAAVVASVVVTSSVAAAQTRQASCPPCDHAAADELYVAGTEALDGGRLEDALAKLRAAHAVCPRAGSGREIAQALRATGALASALDACLVAMRSSSCTQDPHGRKLLEEKLAVECAALKARVPRLRITASEVPPGLRVTRDGVEVPLATLGEALPVDPGEHQLAAEAPGYERWASVVVAREGERSVAALTLVPRRPPPPRTPPPGRPTPVWAWVTGGAGVVSLGVAAGFGVHGLAVMGKLDAICSGHLSPCMGSSPYGVLHPLNVDKDRDLALFIGLGLAGAASVTVALGTTLGSGKTKGAIVVTPVMGPKIGGASLGWRL
jgi:hypothetical protein